MANMMTQLTILYHKETAMALTLGLVAVLMVSTSTFALGAYAQAGHNNGAHQTLQGQVNKVTSSVGQEINQEVTDSVTQANVKVLGQETHAVGKVLAALSYVAGHPHGILTAAILKFKAHKDNPIQGIGILHKFTP